METPHDDVMLVHPLLDDLATEISREYVKMLGRLNSSLAGVLKRAHGITKSEGLYLIQGGLSRLPEADLLKAAKPTSKPRQKMSEAEAARKKKEGVKSPGKRGGKWWRDKHGHVRYGQKPDTQGEDREWQALDEEEVKKLHDNLEAVYGYHHSIRDELNAHLAKHAGMNGELLMQVFRDANSYGLDVGDYWTKLAVASGASEEDAREALSQVFEAYRSALDNPDFRRKARQAIQRRQLEEQHAGEQLKRSSKYSDGKWEGFFSGNAKDEAVRILGLMSDMELLHIPHTVREAQESFDTKKGAKKNIGNIVPNKARLQALYARLDEANGAQLVATYVAQMFRDMREGKFWADESQEHQASEYFKDEAGNYETDILPEGNPDLDPEERIVGASEIERANLLLNTNLLDALSESGKGEDLSDNERAKFMGRIRELAHEVHNYVESFNSDQGGQELGLIFTNQVSPESLFKDDDALKELSAKVEAKKRLVEDALTAQSNDKFETPASMKKGFGEGQDLLPYQRQALNWMDTMKRGILAYDTGMGKSKRVSEPVLTTNGWKPIGKLEVGEQVYGSDGKPHSVLGVYPQGVRPLFEVTFSDGASVVCDEEHLWNVNTKVRNHRGQPHRTLTLREIMAEGLRDNGGARHFIPVVQPIQHPAQNLPLDPYTLGALLGDGCLQGTPCITTDKVLVEGLRLPRGVSAKFKQNASEDGSVGSFSLSGEGGVNPLTELLLAYNLHGTRSWEKFIPKSYLFGSVEQRFSLLQGLLDTDGYFQATTKTLQFSSSSPALALDVQQLVWSLGGTAKMAIKEEPKFQYQGAEKTGRPSYILTIRLPESLGCPFRLPRRVALWEPKSHYTPVRSISKIRPVKADHAVCIKVDAADQLFVTKDYILTHNTPMSIAMVAHMQELVKQGKMNKEDARGIMVMPLGLTKQWPNEIKRFFPDAKVVTIGEDIEGVDDRIKVMEAIQSGALEADFVILSSSVVNFHNDTREAFKSSELFEETKGGEMKKKKGVSENEVIAGMRDAAAGDKLCTALRNMKGCVFFDEAHHEQQGLKSATNVRNAAAREFLKDRERSFLLTATPMPNGKPNELFELMDLIHPGSAGPDVKKFENKMSARQFNPETGDEELVGLEDWGKMAKDISPYVFRKSKLDADVLAANEKAGMKLPPLVGDEGEEGGATHGLVAPESFKPLWENAGNFKPHDFDERQSKLPKEKQQEFKPLDELKSFGKQLRIMHQQQMLSVTPKLLFGPDPAKWPKGYNGEQPKLEHMASLVKKHFQEPKNHDRPIVIFSQWPGSFQYAKEELKKQGIDESLIGEIHGDVDADDRNAVQEAANAGKLKVVFVGTQAGGAGLNLQKKSNKMIFLDQPWMIAHKQQALGRVWRTGQKNPVEVINLYLKGTFDEKKLSGLEKKSATDVAASSAHLDEETMHNRAQNMFLQVLGGKDATKIESLSDADLQARIDAKGLTNLVTPKALKQKFDIKPFSETVQYRNKLDFGQQAIQTKRTVVDLKHSLGELTDEEHKAARKRLGRLEHEWVQQNKLLGRENVAMAPKDMEPIEPEPTYVVSPKAGEVKSSQLSETARAILQTAKKTGGSITPSDFIDRHLKEHVEKEVERDQRGRPVDPMAHLSTVKKWHENRDDIEKEVKGAFKELEKLGALGTRSGKAPKAGETPLPQTKAGKVDPKTGKPKHEPKPTPTTEAENNPKVGINYSGGWGWNTSGPHTKTKEYKKAEVDLGNKLFVRLGDLVQGIQSDRRKPKDFASLQQWLGDVVEGKVTDAATKKCIKLLHEHGVMV